MGQRRSIAGSRMLITGASQGIGRALALAAVQQGAKVLAAARKEDLLQQLKAEAKGPGVLEYVIADVCSADDRAKMVEAAKAHFGGLDILVNNAGIGATGHFADIEFQHLRTIFEVNFFALAETIRVFLPTLKQGTKPAIVNISSIAGKRGIPARSHYSTSKFAVQGFSEAIRAELTKDGIDVLIVNPGLTQTNFSQNMLEQKAKIQMDHMRGMTAEQVALATLKAIARGKNETTLSLNGKLLCLVARFLPWVADMVSRKKVRELFKDEMEERAKQRSQSAT